MTTEQVLSDQPTTFNGVFDVPGWTLGDRMRKSLRHAEISVGDMAADLGVSVATIGRWLNDRGPVKASVIRVWAMTTGVSPHWLETGEAPTHEESWLPGLRACRDSNPKPSDPGMGVNRSLTLRGLNRTDLVLAA